MDSERIAEDYDSTKISTKCPNCGMVYDAQKPDGKPPFFSIRKPLVSTITMSADELNEPDKTEPKQDARPAPDVIPDGMFWCRKCMVLHRVTSKIGIRHLKHRYIQEG